MARSRPVRRRRRVSFLGRLVRTALEVAVLGLAVFTGWAAWQGIAGPNGFVLSRFDLQVERAKAVPNGAALAGELESLLTPLQGRNLLTVDLREARTRLESHPRVAAATVRRRFPDTIEAQVREREPAAVARIGGRTLYVDSRGWVLGDAPGSAPGPVLAGLDALEAGVRPERIAAGIAVVRELEDASSPLLPEIGEVDLASPGHVVLRLRGGPALLLPLEGVAGRTARWLGLRGQIEARVGPVRRVDLRWDGQIAVTPATAADGG